MLRSVRSVPLAVAGALVLVTGCTSGGPEGAVPRRSPSPGVSPRAGAGPSPGASSAAAPAAPRTGACYRLDRRQLALASNGSRPVPCAALHTTRTVFVGRLGTAARPGPVRVDAPAVRRRLAQACPRRLASYVGGSRETRLLSRLSVVWFSPTLAQADDGARWFRCDLIGFDRADDLYPLPRSGDLRGVLARPGALRTFGLCGTAAPGSRGFERVICARRHAWRAFSVVDLPGGGAYPGRDAVRSAGAGTCKDRARAEAGGSLTFRYGWEWPTREQWTGGQHYGYCWVPA